MGALPNYYIGLQHSCTFRPSSLPYLCDEQVCQLRGCSEPVCFDSDTGRVYDFCCRRHANKAMDRGEWVPSPHKGTSVCKLPGCKELVYRDSTTKTVQTLTHTLLYIPTPRDAIRRWHFRVSCKTCVPPKLPSRTCFCFGCGFVAVALPGKNTMTNPTARLASAWTILESRRLSCQHRMPVPPPSRLCIAACVISCNPFSLVRHIVPCIPHQSTSSARQAFVGGKLRMLKYF